MDHSKLGDPQGGANGGKDHGKEGDPHGGETGKEALCGTSRARAPHISDKAGDFGGPSNHGESGGDANYLGGVSRVKMVKVTTRERRVDSSCQLCLSG